MKFLAVLLTVATLLFAVQVPADNAELEKRYRALIAELRCLVCQNQSLADSNAELAGDMRREVHQMMEQGQSDEQIVQFLVDRYGDFVRYRPPVTSTTALLWFGPLLLLLAGGVIAAVAVRRHQRLARAAAGNSTGGDKG